MSRVLRWWAAAVRIGTSVQATRLALLASGVALLVFSSTFLLAGGWAEEAPEGAAALTAGEQGATSDAGSADLGERFARLDADEVYRGLVRFLEETRPTATPTPTSTPTPEPTATPTPTPPPAPPPASAPSTGGSAPAPTQPPPPPPPPPPPSCTSQGMVGYAQALFDAINAARAQNGMAPLAVNGCVTYVAQIRADDMASRNYFAHESPEGVSAFDLLTQNGVAYGWAGENLARNNYPADQAVQVAIRDLMNSAPHRANILSPNYTQLGVGYAVDGSGMHYFVMVFIGPP